MVAAIILDSGWQSLLVSGFAFIYGLAVLVTVITILVKSAARRYDRETKRSEIES